MADDEHRLLVDRDRGTKAKALLDNPLLQEALQSLENDCIAIWKNAASMDDRERAWLAMKVLERVRSHLDKVIMDGEAAATFLAADLHPNKLRT